jgi:hypothetical protein
LESIFLQQDTSDMMFGSHIPSYPSDINPHMPFQMIKATELLSRSLLK